jgi:hypothetical protein
MPPRKKSTAPILPAKASRPLDAGSGFIRCDRRGVLRPPTAWDPYWYTWEAASFSNQPDEQILNHYEFVGSKHIFQPGQVVFMKDGRLPMICCGGVYPEDGSESQKIACLEAPPFKIGSKFKGHDSVSHVAGKLIVGIADLPKQLQTDFDEWYGQWMPAIAHMKQVLETPLLSNLATAQKWMEDADLEQHYELLELVENDVSKDYYSGR